MKDVSEVYQAEGTLCVKIWRCENMALEEMKIDQYGWAERKGEGGKTCI